MRLFVGIDPGSTVGIAITDASAKTKCVETFSKRNFPYSEIIAFLSSRGEPVVIATDKAKVPMLVRKVSAAFGARLFSPKDDMKQDDKKALAKGSLVKNDHEVDALAAALFAKSRFFDVLEKVEKTVDIKNQGAVKKLLLTNQAPNIEVALEMLFVRHQQRLGKERLRDKDKL
jgi:predicted RNase H-like nuclease (RuvC/YqgF family)